MNTPNTAQIQELTERMPLWRGLVWGGFMLILAQGLLWLSAPLVFYFLI